MLATLYIILFWITHHSVTLNKIRQVWMMKGWMAWLHLCFIISPFLIVWEQIIPTIAFLLEGSILPEYKISAAQQSMDGSVWLSSSWCSIDFQKKTDLDCRQASQAHTDSVCEAKL